MKISASYLSIKDNLKENIEKLTSCDIDYLHLDVMDGLFVNNKTLPFDELALNLNNNKPFDIHLMVMDVIKYVDLYSTLNPMFITFHYEVGNTLEIINYIKSKNIKVGLAINPDTEINKIIPFLPLVDLVLIMSVNPGFGGQEFIKETINKINYLANLNYNFKIEVDGGINDQNIPFAADILVIGSYITNGNYEERILKIKEKIYG